MAALIFVAGAVIKPLIIHWISTAINLLCIFIFYTNKVIKACVK